MICNVRTVDSEGSRKEYSFLGRLEAILLYASTEGLQCAYWGRNQGRTWPEMMEQFPPGFPFIIKCVALE